MSLTNRLQSTAQIAIEQARDAGLPLPDVKLGEPMASDHRRILATAIERLRAAVESFAARALQGPYLAYAFIAEPTDPEVEAARIVCRQRFGEVFKDVLRAGVANGEFPEQSVEVSAACIVGAFTEALVRPVAPSSKASDARALIDAIADFCVRAAMGNGPIRSA